MSRRDEPDPTEFDGNDYPLSFGTLPAFAPGDTPPKKDSRSNAATGASAAGVRAFTAQAVAFYFRAPVKAFFRTRVDYLAYARSLQQSHIHPPHLSGSQIAASKSRYGWLMPWWRSTTPGLLAHAIKTYGWRVLPDQVVPPLIANVAVGAVLYTSYLQILGHLHAPSGEIRKRVYPPPSLGETFLAGTLAGGIQSFVAAPLDALQVRYDRRLRNSNGNGNGSGNGNGTAALREKTMWVYGKEKLGEIGARGIFAGWTLSFAKDSLGSGVFFATFEWVKAQGYYNFVRWYYGALQEDVVDILAKKRPESREKHRHKDESKRTVIRPHYALEPGFLLLAGMSATITQASVLYPLSLIQTRHFERLEQLDEQAKKINSQQSTARKRGRMVRAYYHAYLETWAECRKEAVGVGGMSKWLYRGFWWTTIRQVPSTSAGLIIFELVRRKYGFDADEVKITQDGYDILLI